jgi:Tripartite tricarboxylate transporter family receptor
VPCGGLRRPGRHGAARRRRHGGVRLDDAAAPRHSGAPVDRPTSLRPPRLARPIWPGCNRASIRIHRRSRRAGRSTAVSLPPWMKRPARERSPPGSTPSTARWAAMTLRARHRMPAVHFIGGLMRAGRRTYVSLGAVGNAAVLPAVSSIARAQTYPARFIRLVCGFPPGGSNDLYARLIGQSLSERLRQQFVVENRTGAGGSIATGSVAIAPRDGYSSLLHRPMRGTPRSTITSRLIMFATLHPYQVSRKACRPSLSTPPLQSIPFQN